MADTVIVRGAGGALFEMDVPTGGNRLDLWEDKLAKGELVIVTEPVEWVEHQGAMVLRIVEPPADEPAEAAEEQEPAEPRRRTATARPDRWAVNWASGWLPRWTTTTWVTRLLHRQLELLNPVVTLVSDDEGTLRVNA